MDDETRKIAMLIAAFEAEQAQSHGTVEKVTRSAVLLQHEVRNAARVAVEAALKELHPHVNRADQTLVDLQRRSLWRASLQRAIVALIAFAITVLAVWWYVPAKDEIAALRNERDQLQASIKGLKQRGARIAVRECGPQKKYYQE